MNTPLRCIKILEIHLQYLKISMMKNTETTSRGTFMEKIIRHLEPDTPFALADEITCLPGQILSKTLVQNRHHSLTLFAFDKGEEIGTHNSSGDALVQLLEGEGQFTVGDNIHTLRAGQSLIMSANVPHSVYAAESFKMLLTVVFPENEES